MTKAIESRRLFNIPAKPTRRQIMEQEADKVISRIIKFVETDMIKAFETTSYKLDDYIEMGKFLREELAKSDKPEAKFLMDIVKSKSSHKRAIALVKEFCAYNKSMRAYRYWNISKMSSDGVRKFLKPIVMRDLENIKSFFRAKTHKDGIRPVKVKESRKKRKKYFVSGRKREKIKTADKKMKRFKAGVKEAKVPHTPRARATRAAKAVK